MVQKVNALDAGSAGEWMQQFLLSKEDQVVVPKLNLKSAKRIFVRSERQKKQLRKLGFIEDRIEFRNQQS